MNGETLRKPLQRPTPSLVLLKTSCLPHLSGYVRYIRKFIIFLRHEIFANLIGRITALFNALAIHVYSICTSYAVDHDLAEMRAKVCMMGLASMQKSWPVGGWVLKLFDRIMEKLKTPIQDKQSRKSEQVSFRRNNSKGKEEYAPISWLSSAPEPAWKENNPAEQCEQLDAANSQHVNSLDGSGQANSNPRVDFGVTSQSISDMEFNFSPNMFTIDDAAGRVISGQEMLLQWLDLPSSQDVGPEMWPA